MAIRLLPPSAYTRTLPILLLALVCLFIATQECGRLLIGSPVDLVSRMDIKEVPARKLVYSSLAHGQGDMRHSTILCHFGDMGERYRTCHLENVCWDRRDSNFVFFRDPDEPNSKISGDTPPIVINRYLDEGEKALLPLVERSGPIPLQEATISDHEVHIHFQSWWAENFGHALVDDMSPIYALTHLFNMQTRDMIILARHAPAGQDRPQAWSDRLQEMARLFTDHDIVSMSTHPLFSQISSNDTSSRPLTCMRHLLAGTSATENLHYESNYIGSWPGFIDSFIKGWAKLVGPSGDGSTGGAPIPPPITKQLLVLIMKEGRRRILNVEELASEATRTLEVETIIINPGNMTLVDQISVAQRATVTFGPCGGISFFNAFLREGATAVIVDYWHPDWNSTSSMEGYFWKHVTRQQTLRYSVKEEEVVILPPGNSTRKSFEDYRNYGATVVDIDRALLLIKQALYTSEHVFKFH